jgi:uncharacterized protein with PQ loop repeat
MPFQLGTNWSRYADITADVLGPLMAYEAFIGHLKLRRFLKQGTGRHRLSSEIVMVPPDPVVTAAPATGLEKILRALSVVTMVMTVPQVLAVWTGPSASGVSLVSWAAYLGSACLWFVYGLQKRDKTIYVACVGWVALDAAIVAGVIVRG